MGVVRRHPYLTLALAVLTAFTAVVMVPQENGYAVTWAIPIVLGGMGLIVTSPIIAASIWAGRRKARKALAARADYEHSLIMADDPRGIYGQYPPE